MNSDVPNVLFQFSFLYHFNKLQLTSKHKIDYCTCTLCFFVFSTVVLFRYFIANHLMYSFMSTLIFFFFLRKISPDLTSAANPLLFLLRKVGPELTSMPIFLYFICRMPATAWLSKWCHVHNRDLNPWTTSYRSGTCTLNHCATGLAPRKSLEYYEKLDLRREKEWKWNSGCHSGENIDLASERHG